MERTMKITRTVFALAAFAGSIAALPRDARAADSVRLEEHEEKGYFDKFGRVGGFVGFVNGTNGPSMVNQQGAPGASFTRMGYGADFDLLGFWDATRFDTLLGAEVLMKLGAYSAPKTDAGGGDKNYIFFRMDAASTYGLVHWDGAMKGRISGGGGFGMDFDGGRWWTESGRAYAFLLARAQVQVGSIGLHAAYHWVPTTTNDYFVREHRFEGAAGIGALHGGLRLTITTARAGDVPDPAVSREIGAFLAFAF
jgi:hypothetical protein